MLAIAVRQPFASAIISGQKTLEIRSRRCHHRGDILICASKGRGKPTDNLPRGVALGIVTIVDDRPMIPSDASLALRPFDSKLRAWVLRNPRPIDPFPVSSSVGFFHVDIEKRSRITKK